MPTCKYSILSLTQCVHLVYWQAKKLDQGGFGMGNKGHQYKCRICTRGHLGWEYGHQCKCRIWEEGEVSNRQIFLTHRSIVLLLGPAWLVLRNLRIASFPIVSSLFIVLIIFEMFFFSGPGSGNIFETLRMSPLSSLLAPLSVT